MRKEWQRVWGHLIKKSKLRWKSLRTIGHFTEVVMQLNDEATLVEKVTDEIGNELKRYLDLLDFMDLREMKDCLTLRGFQEETYEE